MNETFFPLGEVDNKLNYLKQHEGVASNPLFGHHSRMVYIMNSYQEELYDDPAQYNINKALEKIITDDLNTIKDTVQIKWWNINQELNSYTTILDSNPNSIPGYPYSEVNIYMYVYGINNWVTLNKKR